MVTSCPYKNYGVLFVDDEELALLTFQRLFKEELTIYTAQDGEEALSVIRKHSDIVMLVTDQRMPKMTGVELLKKASQERPDIITILITAYLDTMLLTEAMHYTHLYRADSKPYDPKILKEEVLRGIERYHLIKEWNRLYSNHIESIRAMAKTQQLTAMSLLAAGADMVHDINDALAAVNAFFAMIPKGGAQDTDFWQMFYSVSSEVRRIQRVVDRIASALESEKEGLVK